MKRCIYLMSCLLFLFTISSCEIDDDMIADLIEDLSMWVSDTPNSTASVSNSRSGSFETHMRLQEGKSDTDEEFAMRLFAQNNDGNSVNTINVIIDFIAENPPRENLEEGVTYPIVDFTGEAPQITARFVWRFIPGSDEPGQQANYNQDISGTIVFDHVSDMALSGSYQFEARRPNTEDVVEVVGDFELDLNEHVIPF